MVPIELLAVTLLAAGALTSPTYTPSHAEVALVTPAPVAGEHVLHRKNVISDISSGLSSLGSAAQSYIQSAESALSSGFFGTPLPTGSQVLSSLGISDGDLDAIPTSVLNIPGYANYSNGQWNLRVHGNVYKLPNISNSTIDKLADVFLIDTSVAQLSQAGQDEARNVTREIFVVQQGDVNVTVNILPGTPTGGDGESGGGGGVSAGGINQLTTLPYPTTPEGDFDVFIPLDNSSGLASGTGEIPAQRVNVYAQGTDTGNATSYLVSEEGLTVISDIDDILRVTQIYDPKDGLINSFARPYQVWDNMNDIYRNWSLSLPNLHFHYLTTTPEQITRNYMEFIYNYYPGGSFDDRPLNFSDVSATLSIRKFLLDKAFQTFPKRKFILVADTSNSDVMRDYPQMAKDYPGQVQCIFLRNTSATDSLDHFPYNTAGFEGLNQQMYMFFITPDDLMGLDIVGGQCLNSTIKQNITFGYQGLPGGLSTSNSNSSSSNNGVTGRSQGFAVLTLPFLFIASLLLITL